MSQFQVNSKVIWNSTEVDSKGAIEVKIVGLTPECDFDRDEVGQMYEIQLPDGSIYSAFEDELEA